MTTETTIITGTDATALDATYAAIGTDGMREVVWGLGSTEAAAEADAREQEDPPEDLRTLPITAAAADAVRAGTVGLDGRGGLTVRDGVIEVADGRRAEGAYPTVGVVFARVTDEAIRALRNEAAEAGDTAQVDLCDRALLGDAASRTRCERAICAAWAAAGV